MEVFGPALGADLSQTVLCSDLWPPSNPQNVPSAPLLQLLFLGNRFGHIPNGGRIYYERRSQPPFLTLMVESYLKHTNDTAFLR